jgi:hypothetical protein
MPAPALAIFPEEIIVLCVFFVRGFAWRDFGASCQQESNCTKQPLQSDQS